MKDVFIFAFLGTLFIFCVFFLLLFLVKTVRKQTWKQFFDEDSKLARQKNCKHEKWNCDTGIRTIECINCGKRAWIEDYVNLYP
jgi:hypothetical protein